MIRWEKEGLSKLFAVYDDRLEQQYGFPAVVKYLQPVGDGDFVIDFGCGSGALTPFLTSCGLYTVGVDISEHSLRIARSKYASMNSTFLHVASPDLKNYPFSAAVSSVLFCTLDSKDTIRNIMNTVSSMLPIHGSYVVLDFNPDAIGIDFGTFRAGCPEKTYRDGQEMSVKMRTKEGRTFSFTDTYWSVNEIVSCGEMEGFTLVGQVTPSIVLACKSRPTYGPFIVLAFERIK